MNRNTNKFSSESIITIFFSKLLKINWIIIFCLIFLGLVGVASLYSAAGSDWNPWARNHLIRLIFGFCLMFVIAFIPSQFFIRYSLMALIFLILPVYFITALSSKVDKEYTEKHRNNRIIMGVIILTFVGLLYAMVDFF